ncbi:MAG: hypothetical protein ACLFTP_09720 [Rhodosalinus sp.]
MPDTLTDDDLREHLRKAILLLDAGLPLFEMQAQAERRRNAAEGGLREITCQQRVQAVRDLIEVVGPEVGYFG